MGVVLWVAGAERIVADRRGRLLLLAAAFAFPPVVGELVLGNVHLELLALFALAWWGVRRGSERGLAVAGIAIGVAGLVKLLPLLIVVWFLATGRWRAAVWTVVGALGAHRPDAADHRTRAVAGVPDRAGQHGAARGRDRRAGAGRLAGRGHRAAACPPDRRRWRAIGAILWSARRQVEAASFGVAVAAATLVAPAVFHHYLAMLVLPMLLALAAATPTGWVAVAYLFMWGGQQPALGGLSWILNRVLPALGALLVPVGLLAWGRRSSAASMPMDGAAADGSGS